MVGRQGGGGVTVRDIVLVAGCCAVLAAILADVIVHDVCGVRRSKRAKPKVRDEVPW